MPKIGTTFAVNILNFIKGIKMITEDIYGEGNNESTFGNGFMANSKPRFYTFESTKNKYKNQLIKGYRTHYNTLYDCMLGIARDNRLLQYTRETLHDMLMEKFAIGISSYLSNCESIHVPGVMIKKIQYTHQLAAGFIQQGINEACFKKGHDNNCEVLWDIMKTLKSSFETTSMDIESTIDKLKIIKH